MAAALDDLKRWFDEGVSKNATHMIVVCDTFDHEDYPVYVVKGTNPHDVADEYNNPDEMKRVMEVYDLRQPSTEQLKPGTIVFNFGDDFPTQHFST